MKFGLLLATATAGAVPLALVAQDNGALGGKDEWLKQVTAATAMAAAKADETKTAIDNLQAVLDKGKWLQEAAGHAQHQHQHQPGMGHSMPPAKAAPLKPAIIDGLAQLEIVASRVKGADMIERGWRNPESNAPDVVGAFRFHCAPSHLAYADPILYPGDRTGKSHLHLFFGNTKADADSTYESLRTTGDSTCMNEGNRSGYWQPAMLQTDAAGKDEVVMPERLNIYYKRRPSSDPHYTDPKRSPRNFPVHMPRGLRYVFGYPTSTPKFKCVKNDRNVTDWSEDMGEVLAQCPVGGYLDASINSPPCWDGKNLDSDDHRSHMAYPKRDASTDNKPRCPASHPYEMATFTLQAMFEILPKDRVKTWRFDSDAMLAPKLPRGSSFHADWFGAWEDSVAATWQDWCIDRLLNCSAGALGNGTGLKSSKEYVRLKNLPSQRLPVPKVKS